ncbi:anticodon-binding protein [Plectosphaerella plurivora]|uniref:U3 small nucleolar ribonucleoprotein protein IMP4 n=1 Tax=Plectosphaerella plurivora TaxID=936078 RepID=A0A9P9AI07_9PEZI|nr:anticodon-binding protein [Plectosphaerella plurivora]
MIRKQARLRRDFLYRKAAELKEAETVEKRAKLRDALASGKPLDPSIAKDKALRKDYAYDESADARDDAAMDLDDEYAAMSGLRDSRVLVTTSRSPSSRLSAFSKELRLLFPTAVRLNRGTLILPDLVQSCQSNGLTDLILLSEHRGTPTGMVVSHFPNGPTISFSLHNVKMRADLGSNIGTVAESIPHIICEGFTTKLGQRIARILKHLFPPREPITNKNKVGNRVVTFINKDDTIEVRHHVFVRTAYDSVELSEVGPRMTLKPFEIRQGTLENKDGDVEWHLSSYTRTGRKKQYL